MTEKIGYKLNPKKLKKAPQRITPYLFLGAFYYTEDYEYFDVIKPYLDIPESRKSLEEISQECEEKFDRLIERTKEKFNNSYEWNCKLRRYNEFCEKQNADFEYAKEHGQFPQKPKWVIGTALSANSSITSTFVIKQGNNHEGYYTIGNGYLRFYMPTKPNAITRWFMDKCLSFRWVDEK
jgi:hypothetical protein